MTNKVTQETIDRVCGGIASKQEGEAVWEHIRHLQAVFEAADDLDSALNEFGFDPSAVAEIAGNLNDELAAFHNG